MWWCATNSRAMATLQARRSAAAVYQRGGRALYEAPYSDSRAISDLRRENVILWNGMVPVMVASVSMETAEIVDRQASVERWLALVTGISL